MSSHTGSQSAEADKPPAKPLPSAPPKPHYATIHPGKDGILPDQFVVLVKALEAKLGMPVWLFLQNDGGPWGQVSGAVLKGISAQKEQLPNEHGKICLLLESPGGDAHVAFRITRMFQRRLREFVVAVPSYAKSAATLMSLGASKLYLGQDAELGPLDVQLMDTEREDVSSALDAVQSLERLNAFAMEATDNMMQFLLPRTGKKVETLLPLVLNYMHHFSQPLLQKIDAVDYTKKSRDLKVAEDYAIRLMKAVGHNWETAREVARQLVGAYPTHGFVIDRSEAAAREMISPGQRFGLGLPIAECDSELDGILSGLASWTDKLTVCGPVAELIEKKNEHET